MNYPANKRYQKSSWSRPYLLACSLIWQLKVVFFTSKSPANAKTAQVVAAQTFRFSVFLHTQTRPLLVNNVGQNGKFLPRLDFMLTPIVCQLVARFLPRHALLYPLVATGRP